VSVVNRLRQFGNGDR